MQQLDDDADAYLVRQIRGGDQRAWRQLIERYQGRLLAYAQSRLNSRTEAEDALQEALLGFVGSLRHYDEERSLETYLFAILRYKVQELMTRRRRTLDAGVGFDPEDESPSTEAATQETPSRIAVRAESAQQVARALADALRRLVAELRDKDKLDDLEVIELLFFVGLRNKEAAERLGRDEKAVAGVKFRALGRLREFLDEAVTQGRLDASSIDLDGALANDTTVAQVWRQNRVSCLKRSTIGSYLLGALDEAWERFVRHHLEVVQCSLCRANEADLSTAADENANPRGGLNEQLFASSVGFLSRTSAESHQG